jgi:hypothetical protein
MNARDNHVSLDRLTAMAFVARAPESEQDQPALAHLSRCERCAGDLARLTMEADALRGAAFAEADAVFDDGMLDTQRTRILDRLAHLGQVARVLRFPARTREVAMPVSTANRRWVSVAAAAGLIIGLVAGQMLHFVPAWERASTREPGPSLQQAPVRQPAAAGPATASGRRLSGDELLAEIDEAVVLRSAAFPTLDALMPIGSAGDPRDPLGR